MKEKFCYSEMQNCSLDQLQGLLGELKLCLEKRISMRIDQITHPNFVKNAGAIDNNWLHSLARRKVYFGECENMIGELNNLGHGLKALDLDSDIDFDSTGVVYGTNFTDLGARGIEIEFFPKEINIMWVVTPRA